LKFALIHVIDVERVLPCGCQRAQRVVVAQIVGRKRVLATKCQRSDALLCQTYPSLTPEQRASLGERAVAVGKPVFQIENGPESAAQVFTTFQPPAIALADTIVEFDHTAVTGCSGRTADVTDTRVDRPVQGDTILGVGCFIKWNQNET
jgi:hypothetical protein